MSGVIQIMVMATSGQLWQPAALGSSVGLWLDAADATTITLNGATVSQWRDKSGKNRHVAQSTASNQPTYQQTSFNAMPTVSFDGSNDFISTSVTVVNTATDTTVFLAVKYRNVTTALQSVFATDVSATAPYVYLQADSATLKAYGGSYTSAGTITANATEITAVQRTASGTLNVFRDGVVKGTGTAGGAVTNNGIILGRLGVGAFGAYASVDVSEMIIVNGTLSTENRQKIEGYLAWKWGLQSSLPANHPYKNARPTF